MNDPFAKVKPGDPLRIHAQTWNALMDAGMAFTRARSVESDPLTSTKSSTIIRVRNDVGDKLDRNSVVGLDGPIFSPQDSNLDAFRSEVTFRAVAPDFVKHRRRYAVLLDAIFPDRIGRAYLAGVCQVRVDILDETHEYAYVDTNLTFNMKSSCHGHTRILWREGDEETYGASYVEGVQWCIVMLGVTGSCTAIGKAYGTITARDGTTFGYGKVYIYRSLSGIYSDRTADGPIETIDVLNPCGDTTGSEITDGKYCVVFWDADDVAWVSPLECP